MLLRLYPNPMNLPGSVPEADRVILHTADVLIAIKNVQVYPDGLSFDLWTLCSITVKPAERGMFASPNGTPSDGGLGVEVFQRIGDVEVSRGASIQGGWGSDTRQIVTLFAPLDFVSGRRATTRIRVTWPELGLDESYELPPGAIQSARDRAISFTPGGTQ